MQLRLLFSLYGYGGGKGKAVDKEAIFRLMWGNVKSSDALSPTLLLNSNYNDYAFTQARWHLHYVFYNMFTKRPFRSRKTECLEPWTVPVALKAMNKTWSAITIKESASPTHRHAGSDALSVEPVSQHWLLVVILSRDWSWQS